MKPTTRARQQGRCVAEMLREQMHHLLNPVKQISQDEFEPRSKTHPKLRESEIEEQSE